jgi:hypothetical protein
MRPSGSWVSSKLFLASLTISAGVFSGFSAAAEQHSASVQVKNSVATVQTSAASAPQRMIEQSQPEGSSLATSAALQFIPVTPCRVVDTRNPAGPFGGPQIAAGASREFDIPQSSCNIPSSAVAYSLNVTVVPPAKGSLLYLTLWPSGQAQPVVSTLNSLDGRIKANAAITPAGTNGGVSIFAHDATQVILDIDGYFVPTGASSALDFYPVTPCRVVDTRNAAGPLGGPSIGAASSRDFPIRASACGLPSNAEAYSLNVTAIPHTTLNYLTSWPAGETQPVVSTLNAPTGAITANAAIVPAATDGDISIYVSSAADVVLDVNGYFAPPASGGLSLYTTTPCRVIDTRMGAGAFSGVLPVSVETSACPSPASAQAYVLNATVVPPAPLPYITLWPNGETQPLASTLNSYDGSIASNMAIVPTLNGSIDSFAYSKTNLILDTTGYFAAPASGAIPDGTYAFVFAGTGPQGTPSVQSGVATNGEFTVQNGTVTSGFYDENKQDGPITTEQAITGGSITETANGVGQLVLNSAAGNATYAIAFPASAAPGKDSAVRLIRFDDSNGTAVRGSGVLKPSNPTNTTAAIHGNFAFLLSGSDIHQVQEALVGSFATDGSGNITSGRADANQGGGQLVNFQFVTPGTYSVDANGRGLLKLTLDGNMYFYSFYEVSPTEWLTISIDTVTGNAPLVSGSVQQQSAGPFNVASLPTTSVLQASGLAPGSVAGATIPDVVLGIASSNGAGAVTYSFDEYAGALTPGQSLAVTYTVDPATGRAAGTIQQPILYTISSSNSAFILYPGASSKSGILEAQSGNPFSNASLNGSFLGGSLSLTNTSVLNEAGAIATDGTGNVVFTTNRSTSAGLVPNQSVTGTYTVGANGRVVVTTPDAVTRIFYVVSPRKIGYLTSDGGGYLGSFEQ